MLFINSFLVVIFCLHIALGTKYELEDLRDIPNRFLKYIDTAPPTNPIKSLCQFTCTYKGTKAIFKDVEPQSHLLIAGEDLKEGTSIIKTLQGNGASEPMLRFFEEGKVQLVNVFVNRYVPEAFRARGSQVYNTNGIHYEEAVKVFFQQGGDAETVKEGCLHLIGLVYLEDDKQWNAVVKQVDGQWAKLVEKQDVRVAEFGKSEVQLVYWAGGAIPPKSLVASLTSLFRKLLRHDDEKSRRESTRQSHPKKDGKKSDSMQASTQNLYDTSFQYQNPIVFDPDVDGYVKKGEPGLVAFKVEEPVVFDPVVDMYVRKGQPGIVPYPGYTPASSSASIQRPKKVRSSERNHRASTSSIGSSKAKSSHQKYLWESVEAPGRIPSPPTLHKGKLGEEAEGEPGAPSHQGSSQFLLAGEMSRPSYYIEPLSMKPAGRPLKKSFDAKNSGYYSPEEEQVEGIPSKIKEKRRKGQSMEPASVIAHHGYWVQPVEVKSLPNQPGSYFLVVSRYTLRAIDNYLKRGQFGARICGLNNGLAPTSQSQVIQLLMRAKYPGLEISRYDWEREFTPAEAQLMGDLSLVVSARAFDNGKLLVNKKIETKKHLPKPKKKSSIYTLKDLLISKDTDGESKEQIKQFSEPRNTILAYVTGSLRFDRFPDHLEATKEKTLPMLRAYVRRLLPVLVAFSRIMGERGQRGLVSIPAIGCGIYRGHLTPSQIHIQFLAVLRYMLAKYNKSFPHIDLFLTTYSVEMEPIERDLIYSSKLFIGYYPNNRTTRGFQLESLNHITLYEQIIASKYGKFLNKLGTPMSSYGQLFVVVGSTHFSWPGNNWLLNERSNDEAAKTASTDVLQILTGIPESNCLYIVSMNGFLPVEYNNWCALLDSNQGACIKTEGKIYVHDAETGTISNFIPK